MFLNKLDVGFQRGRLTTAKLVAVNCGKGRNYLLEIALVLQLPKDLFNLVVHFNLLQPFEHFKEAEEGCGLGFIFNRVSFEVDACYVLKFEKYIGTG